MATRIGQIGWEMGLLEANISSGMVTPATVSSVKARTGTYSLALGTTNILSSYGRAFPAATQIRAYTSVNHNNVLVGTSAVDRQAYLFYVLKADGTAWRFGWHKFNALLYITSTLTTVVASATEVTGGISTIDTWHDIAIAIKVDAAAGWLKLYVNGVEAVSFTGNTGTSPVVAVMVGGSGATTGQWAATAYFDDLYIDDTTGDAASAAEAKKFYFTKPNGNGASSQFTGNDGNSTDNYLLVDEIGSHDSNSTFVYAPSNGLVDLYAHEAFTIPVDQTINALIPVAQARKGNATIDTELTFRISKGGVSNSTSQDLLTQYNALFGRFTALPDASTLNEANINLTEVGIVSSGAYS